MTTLGSLDENTKERAAEKYFVTYIIKIKFIAVSYGMLSSFSHFLLQMNEPFSMYKAKDYRVGVEAFQLFALYSFLLEFILSGDTPVTPPDISKLTSLSYLIVNESHCILFISLITNFIPFGEYLKHLPFYDFFMYVALFLHMTLSCIIFVFFVFRSEHVQKLDDIRGQTRGKADKIRKTCTRNSKRR
ncbi:hypothetical protein CRE_06929 [Caenorhabditis remanei]|uniref:Uncharacterized protein n=1 Tax=Caenorhabditis remanei TaxID=31234 RepID=E3N6M7_CAERE|nr:hypothetical protein CRE_06929 [Caenorhabditis remanei]